MYKPNPQSDVKENNQSLTADNAVQIEILESNNLPIPAEKKNKRSEYKGSFLEGFLNIFVFGVVSFCLAFIFVWVMKL